MEINNYVWEKDLSLNDLVLKQKEKIDELQTQLKQKENIIKEVRELINGIYKNGIYDEWDILRDILEILDKENK